MYSRLGDASNARDESAWSAVNSEQNRALLTVKLYETDFENWV